MEVNSDLGHTEPDWLFVGLGLATLPSMCRGQGTHSVRHQADKVQVRPKERLEVIDFMLDALASVFVGLGVYVFDLLDGCVHGCCCARVRDWYKLVGWVAWGVDTVIELESGITGSYLYAGVSRKARE